ncbi:hypothetical protein BV22DRAFT_857612 [Leucogyrophana mollusca]|uniref:Uncharacterized protein n=1 Tax=Leucogyrophana mollusca TaxID=85980 RepID=A0ACB8B264_9AGAM|nr:hypothetical protein BV22DRAFT_857612 [Leucogyrophana mollusca]
MVSPSPTSTVASTSVCHGHFGPTSPRTSVHSLPTEVLLVIFTHLHRKISSHRKFTKTDSEFEHLLSPSLFPYALASVCVAWRDAMSLVPEFWTRLVVVVDNPDSCVGIKHLMHGCKFTSGLNLHYHLQWSRNLPLEVYISTRHLDAHGTDADDERFRISENYSVARIAHILAPHIHRCRILRFKVTHSSSLPLLRRCLRGNGAPRLQELVLESRIADRDDFESSSNDGDSGDQTWSYPCPSLQALHLDGRNFRDVCMMTRVSSSWLAHLPRLHSLTISRSRVPMSMPGFLRALSSRASTSIWTFKVQDVEFADDAEHVNRPRINGTIPCTNDTATQNSSSIPQTNAILTHEFSFETPEVTDLSAPALRAFFHAIATPPAHVTLTRCSFASIDTLKATELSLRDIAADEDLNLARALAGWTGQKLYVYSCPAFNDALLARMSQGNMGGSASSFAARQLYVLEITDCTSFSVAALQAMRRG